MRIVIKNFEIIENLDLTLKPGITCIVGQSCNGKSSIGKALNALIHNKHSDNKIRVGSNNYSIGIQLDNGQQVLCKRIKKGSSSATVYQVNGEKLEKVGRTSLAQVEDALAMGAVDICKDKVNLNYCKQFSYPFLLDKTPTQVYEFLSSSIENDSLFSIVQDMKVDLKEINDNVKRSEGKMDLVKDKYHTEKNIFDQVSDCELYINAILGQAGKVNKCNTIEGIIESNTRAIQELEDSKVQLALVNRDLQAYEGIESIDIDMYCNLRELFVDIILNAKESKRVKGLLADLEGLEVIDSATTLIDSKIKDVAILSEYIQDISAQEVSLSNAKSYYNNVTEKLQNIDLEDISETLDSVKGRQATVKELKALIADYNITLSAIEVTKSNIESTEKQLSEIEIELSSIEVCPLCNTVLNK